MGKLLDDAFEFYAAYHNNPINQWIHIICVWPILWTAFVMATYLDPWTISNVTFGLVDVFAAIYTVYYLVIEQPGIAGPIAAVMVVFCWFTASKAQENFGADVWQPCLGLHIAGWIAQFYGHGVHEGRSPALLDNLLQAIFMAPLFVLMEVLFKFGYRAEFQKRIQVKVDAAIAEFKKAKGGKGGSSKSN